MRRIVFLTVLAAVSAALAGCGAADARTGEPPAGASAGVATTAIAQKVFSRFVTVNNRSNKLRQDSLLATYEAGSSYQIDAGYYRSSLSTDPSNGNYSAFAYHDLHFYIPRQRAYPAWFAVSAVEEDVPTLKNKAQVYFVFSKASASAPWLEVREPAAFGFPAVTPPAIATKSGYALAVSPSDSAGLAYAPDKLPAQDVTYLDVGNIPTSAPRPGMPPPHRPKVTKFVNGTTSLGDLADTSFWHNAMPAGGTAIDSHQVTPDHIYALRTSSGGVLVFYDLTGSITLGAPFAQQFSIKVSGFFDGSKQARAFGLNYVEQFAVYEPPGSAAIPQVLADASHLVSGDCEGVPCT